MVVRLLTLTGILLISVSFFLSFKDTSGSVSIDLAELIDMEVTTSTETATSFDPTEMFAEVKISNRNSCAVELVSAGFC